MFKSDLGKITKILEGFMILKTTRQTILATLLCSTSLSFAQTATKPAPAVPQQPAPVSVGCPNFESTTVFLCDRRGNLSVQSNMSQHVLQGFIGADCLAQTAELQTKLAFIIRPATFAFCETYSKIPVKDKDGKVISHLERAYLRVWTAFPNGAFRTMSVYNEYEKKDCMEAAKRVNGSIPSQLP